jgi:hypothetical protein
MKLIDIHFTRIGKILTCKYCGKPVNDQGLAKVSHLAKCKKVQK